MKQPLGLHLCDIKLDIEKKKLSDHPKDLCYVKVLIQVNKSVFLRFMWCSFNKVLTSF